jgi:hypothetical protein
MTIYKEGDEIEEVELDKKEAAVIKEFNKLTGDIAYKTGISEMAVILYLLDRSDKLLEGKHSVETMDSYW